MSGTKAAVHMWACVHATCPLGDAPPVIRRKLRVEATERSGQRCVALCSEAAPACAGNARKNGNRLAQTGQFFQQH